MFTCKIRGENYQVNFRNLPWTKSVTLLSMGFWVSSLALLSPTAQSQSNNIPYCFVLRDRVSVFSRPAQGTATVDRFNAGDIAYATANPPRTVISQGMPYVEIAIYDGTRRWLPRYSTIDGTELIVDLTPDQCIDPTPGSIGYGGVGPVASTCFFVQRPTNVYSQPNFGAMTSDRYNVGDIAYASFPFNDVPVESGTNAFIQVDIYGGNKAWVPRYPLGSSTPNLIDYPPEDCER